MFKLSWQQFDFVFISIRYLFKNYDCTNHTVDIKNHVFNVPFWVQLSSRSNKFFVAIVDNGIYEYIIDITFVTILTTRVVND